MSISNNKRRLGVALFVALCASCFASATFAAELKEPLDRDAIVNRHHIKTNELRPTLPIGNGDFCFNVDGTGLQTFSGETLSHWGWFSEPLPTKYSWDDVPETGTFWQGRMKGGDPFPAEKEDLRLWVRNSPHQMNLARVRFARKDGRALDPKDVANVDRELNLMSGVHKTSFDLDGERVTVETCVGNEKGLKSTLSTRIVSKAFNDGELAIEVAFPYPNLKREAWTGDFSPNAPKTPFEFKRLDGGDDKDSTVLVRTLKDNYQRDLVGDYSYATRIDARGCRTEQVGDSLVFLIRSVDADSNEKEISITFSGKDYRTDAPLPGLDDDAFATYDAASAESSARWNEFWHTGGAVDLSGSEDPRWFELERRIVLSQFQLRTNSAGMWPSSESGLIQICNWSGRFHLEMIWQHLIHWWVWDRAELADQAISIYEEVLPGARQLSEQLGYDGAKWQKEIAPDGRTAPWVGNLALLWKQPHPIFFAETDYRRNPTRETLEKWREIVELTARHMADYPTRDEQGVYHLDPTMPPDEQGFTRDDLFDLAYWRWGLDAANTWRERLGEERVAKWDEVRNHLEPLPQKDGFYVHSAEWTDTFEKRKYEHPDIIGIYGMVPPVKEVDKETAIRTLERILPDWDWGRCWGWDFPWLGIAGARLGRPDLAIEGLMLDTPKNVYDVSGVNRGGPDPRAGLGPYLPGNAGLLYTIAGMCAGFDETTPDAPRAYKDMPKSGDTAPGFPEGWSVKWENLKRPL